MSEKKRCSFIKSSEFRVVWKRKGLASKSKRYATRAGAERFVALLGPEPWKYWAKEEDPDALNCCTGHDCGCGGLTIRQESDQRRAEMPEVEYVVLEVRAIGPWEPTR